MFISKRCGCSSKSGKCCYSDHEVEKLSGDLTILSVQSRLELLFLLQDKPHCVCDLMEHTGMSQSLISHHIADLTTSGLIEGKREGKYMDYSLTAKGKQFFDALQLMIGVKKGGETKHEKR